MLPKMTIFSFPKFYFLNLASSSGIKKDKALKTSAFYALESIETYFSQ